MNGGRIVASLPIAQLPSATLITTITVDAGQPRVEAVIGGGYAQSTPTAVDGALTVPGRWVDYCDYQKDPSWIAIGWRADDSTGSGARSALEQLLHPGHTETYRDMEADWRPWSAYLVALADPGPSLVSLPNQIRGGRPHQRHVSRHDLDRWRDHRGQLPLAVAGHPARLAGPLAARRPNGH